MRLKKMFMVISGLLVCGILVVIYAYTIANVPQCDETLTQPVTDNCVIGANIGQGLLILLGYFIVGLSVLSGIVALAVKLFHTHK